MPLFRNFLEKRPKKRKRKRESRQTTVGSSDPWIPAPLTRATAHVQHGLRVRGITNPRLFVEPVDDSELLIRAREPGPVEPLAPPALIHVGDYRGLEELGYAPVPFPVRGGGGLGRLARLGLALRELRKGVQDRGTQLGRRIDRLGGRAWEGGAGQGKSLEKSTRRSARAYLARQDGEVEERGRVRGLVLARRAGDLLRRTDHRTALALDLKVQHLRAHGTRHRDGLDRAEGCATRRRSDGAASSATRDERWTAGDAHRRPAVHKAAPAQHFRHPSTPTAPRVAGLKICQARFAILRSCLSSELEPFLSEKAGCPGGQGSFRRTMMRGVRARALVARQRGGMLALIGPRRLARRCLPPSFDRNPQNVPDSDVRPSPDMAPEEVSEGPALSRPSCSPSPGDTDESSSILAPPKVVAAQLEALRTPHEPRTNHGIQVMYEFCEGSGSMERSRYFGYSKDLYHFGESHSHRLSLIVSLLA